MPHKDAVSFIIDEMKNEEGERIEVAPHPLEVITFTVPFMLEEGTLMRKIMLVKCGKFDIIETIYIRRLYATQIN